MASILKRKKRYWSAEEVAKASNTTVEHVTIAGRMKVISRSRSGIKTNSRLVKFILTQGDIHITKKFNSIAAIGEYVVKIGNAIITKIYAHNGIIFIVNLQKGERIFFANTDTKIALEQAIEYAKEYQLKDTKKNIMKFRPPRLSLDETMSILGILPKDKRWNELREKLINSLKSIQENNV